MVAHMTGAKGISVDPDLTEKTAKVRAQWVALRGVRSTYARGVSGSESAGGEGVASKSSCTSAQSHIWWRVCMPLRSSRVGERPVYTWAVCTVVQLHSFARVSGYCTLHQFA